jgi:hypothetical protein
MSPFMILTPIFASALITMLAMQRCSEYTIQWLLTVFLLLCSIFVIKHMFLENEDNSLLGTKQVWGEWKRKCQKEEQSPYRPLFSLLLRNSLKKKTLQKYLTLARKGMNKCWASTPVTLSHVDPGSFPETDYRLVTWRQGVIPENLRLKTPLFRKDRFL